MLFGSNNRKPPSSVPAQNAPGAAGDIIFDVGVADFEDRVLRASMERPVVVDFWAPWCGPCKQLGPVLETAVTNANGAVLMAKVNIDENQQLAAALRIQSIPAVFAFFQGRPVDAFMGAQPESQIKTFVDKLVAIAKQSAPDAIDIPEALKAAAHALSEKDVQTALMIYSQILSQDENNAQAFAGLIRTLIAGGDTKQAKHILENAPDTLKKTSAFAEATTALELAQASSKGFEKLAKKVEANPADHQARIDLALAQFAAGERAGAVESLLESIRRERDWNEQAARKQLLKFFEAMGGADPLTVEARKKLSSILFS